MDRQKVFRAVELFCRLLTGTWHVTEHTATGVDPDINQELQHSDKGVSTQVLQL